VSSSLDHQEHAGRPSDTAEPSVPPTVSIACTSCRNLVPVGAACPHCGCLAGPLLLDRVDDEPEIPAEHRKDTAGPPEGNDVTAVLPPAPPRTAELDLPRMPAEMPAEVPAEVPSAAPSAAPPAAPSATSRRLLAVACGAAALVLVGAAAVAGLRRGSGDGDRSPSSATNAVAEAVPVDPAGVRAAASSTQQADRGVTYIPKNTLDGRPQTAWNSDGEGVGASLTYTFAEPVDLRSLTVRNGYQKRLHTSSGAAVDLYALNERVRTFIVVTDAGRVLWNLRDERAPQTLTRDFGRTRRVRLEVSAVYPSAKYHDLALSDVTFAAAP
jgi:hypothetical protein